MSEAKAAPQAGSLARSAVLVVGFRWLNRLLGVISTMVLARLLVPEDFGITAMASIVVGLASVLLDIGVNVALIRNRDATTEDFQSAWTLRLIQTTAIGLVLLALSPFTAHYFRDPRVTPVVAVMAFNIMLYGLENIGIIEFQKRMQFGLEFRYLLVNRVFGVACTIALAWVLRSYWALVLASTAGAVFTVLHSYLAHPMRPRLTTRRMREILSVSQWMLLQNIGAYVDGNLHKLLVGRRDDTAAMGAYSLANEIAAMPSTELLQPLNRALFPAFVALTHDLVALKRSFLLAQAVQVMVAIPAATLLALLAHEVVYVMLGPKWLAAVPLIRTLAIASAIGAASASAWYVSVTLGRERRSALVAWGQVLLFIGLAAFAFPHAQAQGLANLRVLVVSVGLMVQLWIVARALGGMSVAAMLSGLWRSLASVGVSSLLVLQVAMASWSPVSALIFKSGVFVGAFIASVWVLWRLSGRPDGAEAYLGQLLRSALAVRRRHKRWT